MKLILSLLLVIVSNITLADTHVRGYTRQDGTYVEPHYRTDSNNTKYDNYSTKGNTNPYTGQQGYKNPEPDNQYNIPSTKPYEPYKPYGNNE